MTPEDRGRSATAAWVRALKLTAPIEQAPTRTLPLVIAQQAAALADASAIETRQGRLSYAALAALSHRYARWALAQGIRPGEVVALQMPNQADYLGIWLGLTRIGAIVALIGPKLTGDLLVHAIDAARPVHLIAAAATAGAVAAVRPRFASKPRCWVAASGGDTVLDPLRLGAADHPLDARESALPTLDQCALLIYTSGTTGLPKAARVSHYRLMQWSHWFAGLMGTGPGDRLYNCLPLHHSVGGVVATGAALVGGGAVVLRPQFSASEFWHDVSAERCTIFQYIGELCRYLVNAAPAPVPAHSLRLACGNGLRPEVWERFTTRFAIPRVLEYYAATEGNFSLYNCEQEPGSIGRIPSFLRHRASVALVRFDVETGQPLRDAEGRCEHCEPDEVGAALGWMPPGTQRTGRFEGYLDAEATRAKVLRDVFEPGDAWYQTGDLMRRDARGFFYFVDRIGATYRWKGENVSTTEVAAQLTACTGVREAAVYGVAVPGADGRAGMAALVVDEAFELARFQAELTDRLPEHARPVFLRIVDSLQMTETHKSRLAGLAAQGYDIGLVRDPLYWRPRVPGLFVPLDAPAHRSIQRGELR